MSATECVIRANGDVTDVVRIGDVALTTFVSGARGATGLSTGIARFGAGSSLPRHLHDFSEAMTVLQGRTEVLVEDRTYLLETYDCIHIPANLPHTVRSMQGDRRLVAHWAFANAVPSRTSLEGEEGGRAEMRLFSTAMEHVVRATPDAVYELAEGAFFVDGFAHRFGSRGICGGHGRFLPGASLPCHTHDFDESITIVQGRATCLVEGRSYELSDCDTALVPRGLAHRFINTSDEEMVMIWVYAGGEPDRTLVDQCLCESAGGSMGER